MYMDLKQNYGKTFKYCKKDNVYLYVFFVRSTTSINSFKIEHIFTYVLINCVETK